MTAIVPFQPRAVARAEARVREFITLARDRLTNVLVPDSEFSAISWNTTKAFTVKGNAAETWLHFVNAETGRFRARDRAVKALPLAAPFLDFAQAYIRYQHAATPVGWGPTRQRIQALRYVEAAFRSLGREPEIWMLDAAVLDRAMELVAKGCGTASYRCNMGWLMEVILRFCTASGLLASDVHWKSQAPKRLRTGTGVGKEFDDRRAKRLPSDAALDGLAHVFRNPKTEADRMLSAVSAICCAVPIRAHEVLQLALDCEAVAPRAGGGGAAGTEGAGHAPVEAYGIRVWPGKGNAPQVKWVPDAFVPVVREAVTRLREGGTAAREVAAWYERNPDRLWLPPHLEHLRREEWLLLTDVQAVLGLPNVNSTLKWIGYSNVRKRNSERRSKGGKGKPLLEFPFADVERALLEALPKDFPHPNGLKSQTYTTTLLVVQANGLDNSRTTIPCVVEAVGYGHYSQWLRTVFKRHGLTERDGKPIRLGTHAPRHWLNTVAQRRGVSQLDIAKWSGRHPDQNHHYDHQDPGEILEVLRRAMDDEEIGRGPVFEAARSVRATRRRPVPVEEVKEAQVGAGHVTDAGICIHDYSLLPCQRRGGCFGCPELVFVKGDAKHRARIEFLSPIAERQLAQARTAMDEEAYGADRWVRTHAEELAWMRRMLAFHDDPSIPDGTVVNLEPGEQDSEIDMALRDQEARAGNPSPSPGAGTAGS